MDEFTRGGLCGGMSGGIFGFLFGALLVISSHPPISWIDNLPYGTTITIFQQGHYSIVTPTGSNIEGTNLPHMIKALSK